MKIPAWFLVAVTTMASGAAVFAKDLGTLYDNALLKKWQPDFKEDIVWNFENVILPKLTPEEKGKLRDVKIEVPLRGQRGDPFEFYAVDGVVNLPAMSLRFFGDLSLAYAWLNENHYNVGTVQQYIGMVYYRTNTFFSGGLYPRPLDALQIPADARNDKRVADSLNKMFTSATIFILCHELGHVYYRHPGNTGVRMEISRANEAQADAFAIELMRRIGVIPVGAPFWFGAAACVEAHRVDFPSAEDWQKYLMETNSHPLTADRIESLAAAIEKGAPDFARTQDDPERGLTLTRYVTGQMRIVGEVLKDEDIHKLFRFQSSTTDVAMLAPRRGTAFEVRKTDEKFSDEPFSGVFDCTFGSKINHQEISLRLVMRRNGQRINGEYSYGVSAGTVSGYVEDEKMLFEWQEGGVVGKGRFNWKDGGTFTGTWGNKDSRDDGGDWTGKRQ